MLDPLLATSLGLASAGLCAVSFLGIGASAFPLPDLLAKIYGTPIADAAGTALIRALALRDIALGLALAVHVVRGQGGAAAVLLAVTALVAVVDFGLVFHHNGRLVPQHLLHASGFGLAAGGAVLLTLGG